MRVAGSMRMPTRRPARISAASTLCPARQTPPPAVDAAFDLDGVAVLDRWQRCGTGRYGALAGERGQVVDAQVGADGLDADAGDEDVDQVAVGPDPGHHAGPVGAHPELALADHQVARRRDDPVDSTGPPGVWGPVGVQRRVRLILQRSGVVVGALFVTVGCVLQAQAGEAEHVDQPSGPAGDAAGA